MYEPKFLGWRDEPEVDNSVRLLNREGKEGKIPWPADDKPVTIWEPSMKDAVALITKELDAVEA